MSREDSVTQWISGIKAGNPDAAAELWNRCFEDLVAMARRRFRGASRRVEDEEDAALSVIVSLCRGAADGRFDQLQARDDLWPLLVTLTRQKVVDRIRTQARQKRGGGRLRGESVFFGHNPGDQRTAGLDNCEQRGLSPEFLVDLEDSFQRLMSKLGDRTAREIVLLRVEGYTNQQIGEQMNISEASVRRKLKLIRETWELHAGDG